MTNPQWRKSSYSGTNGSCVELAEGRDGGQVLVRNSNRPDEGTLALTRQQLHGLLDTIKAGNLDDLS